MKAREKLTVSAIARKTGIDRRAIQRALLDVEPIECRAIGARQSPAYDRDVITAALAAAGLPLRQVGRIAPFGGSVARGIAWTALMGFVTALQRTFAAAHEDWPAALGITEEQAARLGAGVAGLTVLVADRLLSTFGESFPDAAAIDDSLCPGLPVRNAAAGEFSAAIDLADDPKVGAMFRAALKAARADA